jgi:hypothetical protein
MQGSRRGSPLVCLSQTAVADWFRKRQKGFFAGILWDPMLFSALLGRTRCNGRPTQLRNYLKSGVYNDTKIAADVVRPYKANVAGSNPSGRTRLYGRRFPRLGRPPDTKPMARCR